MKEGTESLFVGSFDTTNSVAKRGNLMVGEIINNQQFKGIFLGISSTKEGERKLFEIHNLFLLYLHNTRT